MLFFLSFFSLMTQPIVVEWTSGEVIDIVDSLEIKQLHALQNGNESLALYYKNLADSFQPILKGFERMVPEQRIAKMVMAL